MKRRRLRKESIYTFIFVVIILFIFTFNITSSRYIGTISSDSEILAVPTISLNKTSLFYDITNMLPGDTKELEFIVTNIEESQVNEVLLSYDLEFIFNGELPLSFKLFDENDNEVDLLNNKTSEESMEFEKPVSKKYKLQVIWDRKDDSYEYANQNGTLEIHLKATQVI